MPTGIASSVRPPQMNAMGGVNPMELMTQMMNLRNVQQQYNANIEAGQILASSPDMDSAMERLRQSPNAAWQLPVMNQIREGQLTQARIGQTQAETTRTQFGTDLDRAHAAIKLSTTPDSLVRSVADAKAHGNASNGYLFDDIQGSLLGNLPPDPQAALAEFQKRQAALLIGSGLGTSEAYGAQGRPAPQLIQGPYGPGGAQMPLAWTGSGFAGGGTGGPGTGGPMGLTPEQQKMQETRGGQLGTYKSDLEDNVETGSILMSQINEGRRALSEFQSGPGTTAHEKAAEILAAAGASPEMVSAVAGGSLSAIQEYQKLKATQAMAQLDAGLPAGSRTNQREWQTYLDSTPGPDMLPGAINRIYDLWTRGFIRKRLELDNLNDHVAKGGGMEDWRSKWQRIQGSKGLLMTDYEGQAPDGTKVSIPPMDVLHLIDNPNTAAQFDRHYGQGAAERFLSRGG